MEKKIKTLRIILLIGTIILLIAGISFLFVKSVEPWIRTTTMGLISGVLLFLSIYEEYIMKFKGDSIVSSIFGKVSIAITYISISALKIFGDWFTLAGDGRMIYMALFFILIALLVLISSVRYKVYKLIELSIWLTLVSIAFILRYFNVDDIYIYLGLIGITLLYNLIRITGYSKWATFAILIFGIGYLGHDNELFALIIGLTIVANIIAIIFRSKKNIIPFMVLLTFVLPIMSHTCIEPFFGLLIAVGLDIILVATKVFNKDGKYSSAGYIFFKIFMQIIYLTIILFSKITGPFLFIVPTVVLIPSLISALLLKDEGERAILPFKLFYFTFAIFYNLPFAFMKDYLALFIANMAIVFLYLLSKKNTYKVSCFILLFFINILALVSDGLIGNIIFTILFAIDFYILYVKEEKGIVPLSIIFVLQGLCAISLRESICPESLIATALMYGIFICITIKNKFLFASCLVGFIASVSSYLGYIGVPSLYLELISNTLIFVAIVLYQFVCIENQKSKSLFIGICTSLHIAFMLLYPGNVLLKVFALVESIIMLLFSIKNDEHKGLFDLGIIGVVVSLLFILGTFESLPKSLYLIIVAMAIIIITPILIARIIRKQKQEALLHPKEEVKEEVKEEKKETKTKKIVAKFCAQCGTKIEPNSSFCSECGHKIK